MIVYPSWVTIEDLKQIAQINRIILNLEQMERINNERQNQENNLVHKRPTES